MAGFSGFFFCGYLMDVGLTGGTWFPKHVGMRVSVSLSSQFLPTNTKASIVEYATREQAQQAVSTLSNQNLMGRLVYVREVCSTDRLLHRDRCLQHTKLISSQGSRSGTSFYRRSGRPRRIRRRHRPWRIRRRRRWWLWRWSWRRIWRRTSNLRLQRLLLPFSSHMNCH